MIPIILLLASPAHAQTVTISVLGVNNQTFGSIYRSSSASIGYETTSAARFTVTGRKNRQVRLTIVKSNLARTGTTGTATLSLSNSDCAYSLDGGATWTTFSSGTLYTDTAFPNNGGNNAEILVRVGGTVSAASTLTRGTYTGSVTLSASYL